MGSGGLGWHNVGAGPSGGMHPVTGWDTCANECAFACMRVRAGVWGCLTLVHSMPGRCQASSGSLCGQQLLRWFLDKPPTRSS